MRRSRYVLLLAVLALALPGSFATAALSDYIFSSSTGTSVTPSSYTNIWAGTYTGRSGLGVPRSNFAGQQSLVSMPFTFFFNCVGYNQLMVSSHGLIGFGSAGVNTSYSNNMPSAASSGPVMAPLWDRNYIAGPASSYCQFTSRIRYGTAGTAPTRIFVIDYEDISVGYGEGTQYGPQFQDWQVRLYEGSNRIEFFYSNAQGAIPTCLTNWGQRSLSTSASIGLAATTSDFMSITPGGGSTASMSRSSFNNNINLGNNVSAPIGLNALYTFTPSGMTLTPNVAQGGVTGMANGSVLMSNIGLTRGGSQTYQPFTLMLGSGCGARNLTISLSGVNAGDYSVSPIGTQPFTPGVPVTFNVTFTPQSIGQRTATLTISDPLSGITSYTLRATGLPRISWNPNIAQGATPGLVSGDTIMRTMVVRRNQCQDFTPIMLQNFSTNTSIPPAPITYSIDSAGRVSTQYSIASPSVVNLAAGQTSTPIIRFCGTGLGPQSARLTVNADGEIRTFTLLAVSGAPGIAISGPNGPVDAQNPLYHQAFGCVGDQAVSFPLTVSNPGAFEMTINQIDIYRTDTTYGQGTPTYPFVRDERGRLVPMTDYMLSESPGLAPASANTPVALPFAVAPNSSRTLYAVFIGQNPGKRFGRAYIRTNAENVFGTDTTVGGAPNSVMGLVTVDLVGRAFGSQLAATAAGEKLKPVVFKSTKLGDTAFAWFTIANSGACDLRINRNRLRIYSGDVNEIKMMTSLRNTMLDQTTGDYVIAPGQSDSIQVRFTPSRGGTRRATMWIQTNDSTIIHPGIAERGAYYLDLYGLGLAGLDSRELVLNPVVIGSSVTGLAQLENSQTTPFGVASISFAGEDAAEFSEDASNPWPARPFNVIPGQKLELGVRLTPTGNAGPRRTTMILVSTNNDTVRVPIRGEAGTQTLVVAPSSLFENVTIPVGQTKRQTVMIANDGTLPVRVLSIRLIGPDSTSYVVGQMPRMNLEAGQTEYLEVSYVPNAPGQTSAQIEIRASNGQTYMVDLGGTALRIRRDPIDPPSRTLPGSGDVRIVEPAVKGRPILK